jgi:hypothetical protein
VRIEVCIDCPDPELLAPFWSAALGYERRDPERRDAANRDPDSRGPYLTLHPPPGGRGMPIVLQRVPEPKVGKTRIHLDLYVDDPTHLATEVARLEALGATRVPGGEVEEAGERWVVMTDPAGNEFCLCAS